jgi:hypothetical protein
VEEAKSNAKVWLSPSSLYAEWRVHETLGSAFHDADRELPSERLLQAIWHHQRLRRDRLVTADGRRVQVLHPGFWNREAGPDFRQAVLQIGDAPPIRGDVEVDLEPGGWHAHAHDRNPAFAGVILQVVWQRPHRDAASRTLLPLVNALEAPLKDLAVWFSGNDSRIWPEGLLGQCCAPLRNLNASNLVKLLHDAAQLRLERKAFELSLRSRQVGGEQALWEGLFRALGYKQNVWPMQRLGELLPSLRDSMGGAEGSTLAWQSRLYGVAGLLPQISRRLSRSADRHMRKLWDEWWRCRDAFVDASVPGVLWRFHGQRPANHPQRRIALAAHWLARGDLPARLEQWFAADLPAGTLTDALAEVLHVREDPFWTHHWTLVSPRLIRPEPLLGRTRVTDIAINVVLPWFWMRTAAGGGGPMQARAERRYHRWPKAQDNSLLRQARQRLLGEPRTQCPGRAASQQGLLQILQDFCDRSDALCQECRFPELVRRLEGREDWKGEIGGGVPPGEPDSPGSANVLV